eukprot:scaffold167735_cov30-Tisochrysis_lutea.AAC.1
MRSSSGEKFSWADAGTLVSIGSALSLRTRFASRESSASTGIALALLARPNAHTAALVPAQTEMGKGRGGGEGEGSLERGKGLKSFVVGTCRYPVHLHLIGSGYADLRRVESDPSP